MNKTSACRKYLQHISELVGVLVGQLVAELGADMCRLDSLWDVTANEVVHAVR